MKTYERNGIHLEQCDTCRGIFLDFGEPRVAHPDGEPVRPGSAAAAAAGCSTGTTTARAGAHRGNKHYRKQGFGRLFFSS